MRSLIEALSRVKVLVVGDKIEDVYHFGRVDRLSPEAPVPVFIEERIESRRGGADNVAAQLEEFGCTVTTAMGPVSYKHRYMVGSHQLLRVDEDHVSIDDLAVDFDAFDVIVISDYGKGVASESLCKWAVGCGVPVIVDPKGTNWKKYAGATFICPNEKEYTEARNPDDHNLLIKLGPKGLKIDGELIPATAKQVFDVTGAGDTVVATFAAALGAGASHKDAAILANYAAGVAVSKSGTSVCTKEELLTCVSD